MTARRYRKRGGDAIVAAAAEGGRTEVGTVADASRGDRDTKMRNRYFSAALAATICLAFGLGASGAALADFESGKAAYKQRDFETALREWHASALEGDVESQYWLGLMLANGTGVERDLISAYAWLKLAGDAGNLEAAKGAKVLEDPNVIPRWCQYHAHRLVSDFKQGIQDGLAGRDTARPSRCWRFGDGSSALQPTR